MSHCSICLRAPTSLQILDTSNCHCSFCVVNIFMSSEEAVSAPLVKKEPLTEFQHICYSVLGRAFLRCEASWGSCSTVFMQAFADLIQIQRPWWRMCSLAGIFFFRSHVLIDFVKAGKSLSIEPELFRSFLQRETYQPCPIPEGLARALHQVLDDNSGGWNLFAIPSGKDASQECQKFAQLMRVMKCSDINDFNEWKFDGPVRMDVKTFNIEPPEPTYSREGDAVGEERRAMMAAPGEFYQKLIPSERVQNDECWLFRSLDEVAHC